MDICNSQKVGHQLSDAELGQLQTHLMKMYKDIEAVCLRHGLQISLAYGNVIGAVRHNGWIPWDDDLDVIMPRKDYDLLIHKYASELPVQYKVYSVSSPDGPIDKFTKVIDTTTKFSQITGNYHNHEGVFVDIFPIENFNPSVRFKKFKRYWMYFMMYTVTSVKQFLLKDKFYRDVMYSTPEGKNNYRLRNIWGCVFSLIKPATWYRWIDSLPKEDKETGLVHIPLGQDFCFNGTDADIFFPPVRKTLSDGTVVNIPHRSEDYLDLFYKDWRTIPPAGSAWHHFVKDFYIPETNNNHTDHA